MQLNFAHHPNIKSELSIKCEQQSDTFTPYLLIILYISYKVDSLKEPSFFWQTGLEIIGLFSIPADYHKNSLY